MNVKSSCVEFEVRDTTTGQGSGGGAALADSGNIVT